jgi:tetratricopeptide (TPR) repeat protein
VRPTAVGHAWFNWTVVARFVGGASAVRLLEVLDSADRWLASAGAEGARAPVLLQRALVHRERGDLDLAVTAARDALAAYRPDTAGFTLASHRAELAAILCDLGRGGEAEQLYRATLEHPASDDYDLAVACIGLAHCALDRGDTEDALLHATNAVTVAETVAEEPLGPALGVLVAAQRSAGDLDSAWCTALRHVETANHAGNHYRAYHALRSAVDVALDRGDRTAAASLLDDLEPHARALDTDARVHSRAVAVRRERLSELD